MMDGRDEISVLYFSDSIINAYNLPDVDEPFTLIVIDSRDPDLSEDDRPVCGRCAGNEDEVLVEAEVRQLTVGELRCA